MKIADAGEETGFVERSVLTHDGMVVTGNKRTVATLLLLCTYKRQDLEQCASTTILPRSYTYAVKSAEPVTAFDASFVSLALHTAPLCPRKVPIQSPV